MTAVGRGIGIGILGTLHRRTLCVLYLMQPVLYEAGRNDPGASECTGLYESAAALDAHHRACAS